MSFTFYPFYFYLFYDNNFMCIVISNSNASKQKYVIMLFRSRNVRFKYSLHALRLPTCCVANVVRRHVTRRWKLRFSAAPRMRLLLNK